jgi:2'-deoxynucleoside 5'-phosphate N-hydrolase
MKIYFAGSIRGGRDDHELYFEIIEMLRDYGEVLTDHVGNPELTEVGEILDDRTIHDRDLAWLREANCLIAEVTTPSLGVGYEIGKATEWNKRVLCLFRPSQTRKLSGMIAGSEQVRVREYQSRADLNGIFAEFFARQA